MSGAIKSGGPAFPDAVSTDAMGGLHYSRDPGLSMRDYFAAHALTSVLTARAVLARDGLFASSLNQESIVEEAYELADAMLEAREKTSE